MALGGKEEEEGGNLIHLFIFQYTQLLVPVVAKSVTDMLEQWSTVSNSDEVEIEVSEWFQTLTEEVITRTAFGSSYEDGKAIFRLQAQQMVLAAVAFQRVLIPGYRWQLINVL